MILWLLLWPLDIKEGFISDPMLLKSICFKVHLLGTSSQWLNGFLSNLWNISKCGWLNHELCILKIKARKNIIHAWVMQEDWRENNITSCFDGYPVSYGVLVQLRIVLLWHLCSSIRYEGAGSLTNRSQHSRIAVFQKGVLWSIQLIINYSLTWNKNDSPSRNTMIWNC